MLLNTYNLTTWLFIMLIMSWTTYNDVRLPDAFSSSGRRWLVKIDGQRASGII